jgi:UPF0755 protein
MVIKAVKFFLYMGIVGVILMIAAAVDLYRYSRRPARIDAVPQAVEFAPGKGLDEFAESLRAREIIVHPLKFKIIARIQGHDRNLKAGEYALSSSMSPLEILNKLTAGDILLHRITIPEGFSVAQVAEVLDRTGVSSAREFLALAADRSFLRQMGIDAGRLEGYLFPDTYYFPKRTPVERVIGRMVGQFWKIFSTDWKNRAAQIGLSVHEVVTLASIIEKETGNADERPLVSSVFHNRLRRAMPLESDPTVIFGLDGFDGNLTRMHLTTPNPYNTYTMKGLPPGPIANPGKASLEAALFPAETNFLFFVSKNDSTHYFSESYEEHRRAVRQYQINR